MRNSARAFSALLLLAVVAALFAGCGGTEPSELKYLDDEVVIAGVADEEFTVTIRDLTEMEAVSEKAEGARSNGDIVKITAVGPTLDTFLAAYGKTKADYTSVRFSSLDGYSVIIPKEVLERREIVLAYMDGNKAFDKGKSAPLRVVVIGERAMYWARMINRIEFMTGDASSYTSKLVFLDTVLPMLVGSYSEEEGGDVVSTIDLLGQYGGLSPASGKVYMTAYDGLKKNETIENFLKGGIKYTGELTPQFCSPDLPQGMNMDGIVSVSAGETAYYSLARASELLPEKEGGGRTGLSIVDITQEIGFLPANMYQLENADGELQLYTVHDMAQGVFAQGEDGAWGFYGPEDRAFENVVLVEAVTADPPEQEE
jgi:DMSO/TMAO reductase YedYZ molybdopterin-dependent catalytic subunit